jgi:hypothetical protein
MIVIFFYEPFCKIKTDYPDRVLQELKLEITVKRIKEVANVCVMQMR